MFPDHYEVTIAYQSASHINREELKEFDLVGFSCTGESIQINNAIYLSNIARNVGLPTVVSGLITMYNQGALLLELSPRFDSIIMGDAEPLIKELCCHFEIGAFQKEYRLNRDWRYCDIPVPRFDLIDFALFQEPHVFPVQTARGCPRKCTLCSEFLYSPWRLRPIAEVIDEIRTLRGRYGARRCIFRDDDFLVHPKRSRELLPVACPH